MNMEGFIDFFNKNKKYKINKAKRPDQNLFLYCMIQLGKYITTFIILIFQAMENTGTDDGVHISYIVVGSLGFVVVAIIIVVGIIIYRRYRLFLIFET